MDAPGSSRPHVIKSGVVAIVSGVVAIAIATNIHVSCILGAEHVHSLSNVSILLHAYSAASEDAARGGRAALLTRDLKAKTRNELVICEDVLVRGYTSRGHNTASQNITLQVVVIVRNRVGSVVDVQGLDDVSIL